MTFCHVPFDEIKLAELNEAALCGKKVVVLPDCAMLKPEAVQLLDAFVEKGGKLVATCDTGFTQGQQMLKCLGVKRLINREKELMSSTFLAEESDEAAFPHCVEAPYIAIGSDLAACEYEENTKKYFRLIPEHPFGPPERCYYTEVTDMPGATLHPYGKGAAVYLPWKAGSFYYSEDWQNTLNVIHDVLFSLCGLPEIAPALSPMVELVLSKYDGKTVIHLINASGCFANNYFPPVPMKDIRLRLPGLTERETPAALNGGKAEIRENEGAYEIVLNDLLDYEAIILK